MGLIVVVGGDEPLFVLHRATEVFVSSPGLRCAGSGMESYGGTETTLPFAMGHVLSA